MADGREVAVWDNHAHECREQGRNPFSFKKNAEGMYDWLRETIVHLPIKTCLDIGCGGGYWHTLFEGFEYTGFDQSTEMIKLSKETFPGGEFIQGNAMKLKEVFGERKFDLVFTSSVLQHNRHEPDKRLIVEGMHYILNDGGYYLCTENTFREDNYPTIVMDPMRTNGYSFSPQGWEKWMGEHGFKMIEYSHPSEYLYRKN